MHRNRLSDMYQNHLNICELIYYKHYFQKTVIIYPWDFRCYQASEISHEEATQPQARACSKNVKNKNKNKNKNMFFHVFPQITVGTWYRQLKDPMSLRNHWLSCPPGILLSFRMKGAPRTRDVFLVPQGGSGHWTPAWPLRNIRWRCQAAMDAQEDSSPDFFDVPTRFGWLSHPI